MAQESDNKPIVKVELENDAKEENSPKWQWPKPEEIWDRDEVIGEENKVIWDLYFMTTHAVGQYGKDLVKWDERNAMEIDYNNKTNALIEDCQQASEEDKTKLIQQRSIVDECVKRLLKARFEHHHYKDPNHMVEEAFKAKENYNTEYCNLIDLVEQIQQKIKK